jgi:hypothetical protein
MAVIKQLEIVVRDNELQAFMRVDIANNASTKWVTELDNDTPYCVLGTSCAVETTLNHFFYTFNSQGPDRLSIISIKLNEKYILLSDFKEQFPEYFV